MASLFQILGVLSALVVSGYTLSCTQCSTKKRNSCTGPSELCVPGSPCGLMYHETGVTDFVLKKSYKRICVSQDWCNMRGSISFPNNIRTKMGVSCCTTDHCTPTFPSLPKDSSESNGVTCPACISIDSNHCDCSEMMQCTGNETTCLRMTIKVSVSRDSSNNELICPPSMPTDSKQCDPSDPIDCTGDENLFRNTKISEQIVTLSTMCGCATRSVCDIARVYICDEGITTDIEYVCTSGSTGP